MRIRTSVLLVALLALVGRGLAQSDPAVAAIVEQGLRHSEVMEHLDHLTNRIGPRLTSSDRLTQACEWATDRFKSMGLDARMEEWGTFPVGFNRGPWSGRMIAPREMTLVCVTPAWSAGTKGRQRGDAVLAPTTLDDLAKQKDQLKGRWVLEPADDSRSTRAGADTRPAAISKDVRDALDRAYDEMRPLGIIRSSGAELVWVSGNWHVDWEKLPTRTVISVIDEQWKAMANELVAGRRVELEFDIRNNFKKGPIPLYDVIADLKGTEKPDEMVIVGGHIDSWDGATGTTDNGTGASSTIEAARILAAAGVKPRRTIRFMLWSGEEQGLLGSAAWCKKHQAELDKISAVFVHDGGTNYVSGVAGTKSHQADFKAVFAPALQLEPEMPFDVREVDGLSGGGSDHGSFLAMGVPGFYWDQKGRAVYRYGWHTQNDTYDIAIPEYQRHTATVIALGAYGVANLDHLLSREGLRSPRGAIPTSRVLGVEFEKDTLVVSRIEADSVAAKVGLKVGDTLLELDGVKLKDRFALRATLNGGEPNKTLVLERGGSRLTIPIAFK